MGGRGRKHQRKRDIPILEGRGQKCDRNSEEGKLEENEEEMKWRKQSQQIKILNLRAKYSTILLMVLHPLYIHQYKDLTLTETSNENETNFTDVSSGNTELSHKQTFPMPPLSV